MSKTIGILGGGQLGRMLTDSAHKLGYKVVVLDPTPNSPAGQVADEQIVGSFKDKEKILELGEKSNFITFEIEGVNDEALEQLLNEGKPVNPHPRILKIIKDKFEQKVFLRNKEIAVADFALIKSLEDVEKQAEIFGFPLLLKARFDAYDGRGNYLIKNKGDIKKAYEKLSQKGPLYAEKFVPFIKELAVVAARDRLGNVESFPVVETIHKNNICHIVRSPAPVSKEINNGALALAEKTLKALGTLGGVGVFAVEMFLTEDGVVLVNEIAPRVHNSGHHTIEAYEPSQFEQHIRVITGMPLLKPEQKTAAAVMVNILGERDGVARLTGKEEAEAHGASVHLYGKMETRKERKMGHLTVTGDSLHEAEEKALNARKQISV